KKNKPLDEIRNQMKEILSKTPFAEQGDSTLGHPSGTPEECFVEIRNNSALKKYWDLATSTLVHTEYNLSKFNQYLKENSANQDILTDDVRAELRKLQTRTENLWRSISESPDNVKQALKELEQANKQANKQIQQA